MQCRAAGMDDYLSKPINRDLLYTTIQKWLETAHHADADASRIFCNN
jgi:CheY-like chemotaxis protein